MVEIPVRIKRGATFRVEDLWGYGPCRVECQSCCDSFPWNVDLGAPGLRRVTRRPRYSLGPRRSTGSRRHHPAVTIQSRVSREEAAATGLKSQTPLPLNGLSRVFTRRRSIHSSSKSSGEADVRNVNSMQWKRCVGRALRLRTSGPAMLRCCRSSCGFGQLVGLRFFCAVSVKVAVCVRNIGGGVSWRELNAGREVGVVGGLEGLGDAW